MARENPRWGHRRIQGELLGLGMGFGISQATAYRYRDEAVEVLAAKAPSLVKRGIVRAETARPPMSAHRAFSTFRSATARRSADSTDVTVLLS